MENPMVDLFYTDIAYYITFILFIICIIMGIRASKNSKDNE